MRFASRRGRGRAPGGSGAGRRAGGHTTLFTVSPVPGTGGGVNEAAVLVAVLTAALTAAPTAAPTAALTAALFVLTGLTGTMSRSVGVSGDGPIGDTFIRCSFTRTSSNGAASISRQTRWRFANQSRRIGPRLRAGGSIALRMVNEALPGMVNGIFPRAVNLADGVSDH